MPAKLREAKARRPQFSAEVLALFAKLEATPARQRRTQEFKDGAHQLARKLGLVDEWWTCNSPLERGPCYTAPPYIAYDHWHTCRAVREALLGALRAREVQPADEPAHPAP